MGIELLYSGVQLKVLDLDSSSDITVFLPVFSSGKNGNELHRFPSGSDVGELGLVSFSPVIVFGL